MLKLTFRLPTVPAVGGSRLEASARLEGPGWRKSASATTRQILKRGIKPTNAASDRTFPVSNRRIPVCKPAKPGVKPEIAGIKPRLSAWPGAPHAVPLQTNERGVRPDFPGFEPTNPGLQARQTRRQTRNRRHQTANLDVPCSKLSLLHCDTTVSQSRTLASPRTSRPLQGKKKNLWHRGGSSARGSEGLTSAFKVTSLTRTDKVQLSQSPSNHSD